MANNNEVQAIYQAIDKLNKRIDELSSLKELEEKIEKLEKTQEALKIGVVETLNNFAHIESVNTDFAKAFDGLYQLINPMLESISSLVEFIKE